MSTSAGSDEREPDAAGKPTSLGEIRGHSWRYLMRRSMREFLRDECPDLAAGLTYYGVLAVLPGLIALISLLGVFGQGPRSVTTILGLAREVMPASAFAILGPVLEDFSGVFSASALSLCWPGRSSSGRCSWRSPALSSPCCTT